MVRLVGFNQSIRKDVIVSKAEVQGNAISDKRVWSWHHKRAFPRDPELQASCPVMLFFYFSSPSFIHNHAYYKVQPAFQAKQALFIFC